MNSLLTPYSAAEVEGGQLLLTSAALGRDPDHVLVVRPGHLGGFKSRQGDRESGFEEMFL